MEWKVISGQVCLTAVAIACVVKGLDHGLIYTVLGALAASVGITALASKSE